MTSQDRAIDAVNDLRNQLEISFSGETLLPTGEGFVCCTNSARYLRERLGGRVMGYHHADNPTAELGETEGGHDFLVVDGMIVDLWAADYYDSPVIVHLKHWGTVRRLYGDTEKWEALPL